MKNLFAVSAFALALAACGGPDEAEVEDPLVADDTMMEGDLAGDPMMDDPAMMDDDMAMAGEGAVTVNISGIEPGPGQLMVALQTEDQFAAAEGEYTQMMMADAATEMVMFEDVVPGSYAAAVVHDTNENGEIDMGETGPTEGWGLSGTPQTGGAPEFGPAMFEVGEVGATADVMLTYPAQ